MHRFEIKASGDRFTNPTEFTKWLSEVPDDARLVLDMQSEAPCLEILGIVAQIKDRDFIVLNYPNAHRDCTYPTVGEHHVSHFWWLSERYDRGTFSWNKNYVFGCFIGRKTLARCVILYEMQNYRCISSLMDKEPGPWIVKPTGTDYETVDEWDANLDQFFYGFDFDSIKSIDDHEVRDQYNSKYNTNRDILNWYHDFLVEVSAETYTLGKTFFVTEKTVRPLLSGKGLIMYAPIGYMQHLRDLGLKTFDTLWNEDYDNYQGSERWHRMQHSINQLGMMSHNQLHDLDVEIQKITQHNRTVIANIIEKNKPQ
jgi:hypothetical protein